MENRLILHGLKTVINLTCKTFSNSIKKSRHQCACYKLFYGITKPFTN